jgi:hypothetical protein
MNSKFLTSLLLFAFLPSATAGELVGHLRDPNWYAQYQSFPFGVGQYEYAINANAANLAGAWGYEDTDVYGSFGMSNVVTGSYTVASWDVWWRSAYMFNVAVPANGPTPDIDLRLKAAMWGYPTFWDTTGYGEFGQTFMASGPVSMIYLRAPAFTGAPSYTLTVHEGGPGGVQVGQSRSFGTGDQRPIYGYGQMPTIAGRTYYARIRTSGANGVIAQMDPRPDFSDPMPGGSLWLGTAVAVIEYPDRDLGLVIMSDDDGLITNLYARKNGADFSGMTSIGQTFVARGVGLISAAFWIADPSGYLYSVRVLQGGPGGAQVGTTKVNKPARPNADPEMIVTWSPGECPLITGQIYYLEVTRAGGGTFNFAFVNTSNPFPYGDAYQNGTSVPGTDLAGTIMEEETEGSATRPTVKLISDPLVAEADRGTNQITVQWQTDVAADSLLEFAPDNPPYTGKIHGTQVGTNHSLVLTGLQSHTMYHYRVTSSATGVRPGVSRDFVTCTRAAGSNLLANPGFELGSGASPRSTFPGWNKGPALDLRTSDGSWFWSLKPHSGSWLLEGAVNGNTSDSYIYQTVSNAVPGADYTFSAWVMTGMREVANGQSAWKYDVWSDQGRLIYVRLGVDPTGGTNASANTVEWTPRMYSHRHYTQLAKTTVAQSSNVTVFVSMKGMGGEWHVYGVDDCLLSHENITPRFEDVRFLTNGAFVTTLQSKANRTNVIESSVDLKSWSTSALLVSRSGKISYTNVQTLPERFYRARLLPGK